MPCQQVLSLLTVSIAERCPSKRGPFQKEVPLKKRCPRCETNLYPMVRLRFRIFSMCSTLLLSLLPGPLKPSLIVLVRVLFMGQIEMFKKYFVFNRTAWKKNSGEIIRYVNTAYKERDSLTTRHKITLVVLTRR